MLLDPRTLATAAAFAAIVQVVAMLYVWRSQFRERAVEEMAFAAILVVCGGALALSRPHLPVFATHVLAVAFLIGGHTLGALAAGRFVGKAVPINFVLGLPVIGGVIVAWFTIVDPRLDIRIAVYSAAVAVSSAMIAWLLLSVPRGPLRATHWPVGILQALHAALALVRFVVVLSDEPPNDIFAPTLLQALWFLEALMAINLTFTGMILMITQRLRLELDRQASYDELTGALNRQAFERMAEAEWSRARRYEQPVAVLVLDLDHFKALNDGRGHEAGDVWLRAVADLVRGLLRREDLFCRHGGEEFLALLPLTGLDTGQQAAERIRRGIEGLRVTYRGRQLGGTVSIGVAAREAGATLKQTIAAADRALYQAKANGRNRVEIAGGNG